MPAAIRKTSSARKPYSSLSELAGTRSGPQRHLGESHETRSKSSWSSNSKGSLNALYGRLSQQTSRNGIFGHVKTPTGRTAGVTRNYEESELGIVDGTSGGNRGNETIVPQEGLTSIEGDLGEDQARSRHSYPEKPEEERASHDHGANIDGSATGNDSDHGTASFKPHLPDWLKQAIEHRTGDGKVGTYDESSWTSNPSRSQAAVRETLDFANARQLGYAPFHDSKLESLSTIGRIPDAFDVDRKEGNAGGRKVLPSSLLYPARSSSVGIHGNSTALSLPGSPTAYQPFTTPGPHAKQKAESREGKNIHGRFLPRPATPNPAFAFKRLQTANRTGSVDIEPLPFSRPYIQTSEALAVKNKYAERRKRDLCLETAINLPTIEETAGESWYTSSPPLSLEYDTRAQGSGGNYDHSQNLPFEQDHRHDQAMSGATDTWQASVKCDEAYSLTGNMHDDTQSMTEMLSSRRWTAPPAESIPVYSEVSLGPSASPPDGGSRQTVWMTRQQLLEERHNASDPCMGLYDRSSSVQGDTERYYGYNGDLAHEAGNSSDDQTETAVMDIEILEAAAAAATSEGSITAINAFADGPDDYGLFKLAEGDQVAEELTGEVESHLTDRLPKGSSILSIANSIAIEHVTASRGKTDHITGAKRRSSGDFEPGRQQAEDMESIASFGDCDYHDDAHTELDGKTMDKKNQDVSEDPVFQLQTDYERTEGRSSANESALQDDTPYDSACLFPEEGSHPGFDIYVDTDCR